MSKIWHAYLRVIESLCFAGIAVILIVGVLQVYCRYVLGSSLFWSEELMRYLMLWVVAIGAGLSYSRGQFLGMRLVVDRMPHPLRRAADLVSALGMLTFLAVIILYGFTFAWGTRAQTAIALNVSLFWVHIAIVAAAILLCLHVVLTVLQGASKPATAEDYALNAEKLS